jgi:hypothetical protein
LYAKVDGEDLLLQRGELRSWDGSVCYDSTDKALKYCLALLERYRLEGIAYLEELSTKQRAISVEYCLSVLYSGLTQRHGGFAHAMIWYGAGVLKIKRSGISKSAKGCWIV